jgi:hypothetical protein
MHVYSSDETRIPMYGTLAFLAVIVSIAVNAGADAIGLGPPWLVSAPTVAATFGLLYKWVDAKAWRWQWLHRVGLIGVPVVAGEYCGELVGSYDQTKKLPVTVRVDQTWSRIFVYFEVTAPTSSTSYSVAAKVSAEGNHCARLIYTYKNQVRHGVAESDMADQDGTAEVVIDSRTGKMSGRYFNSRGRQGTLTLSRV